MFSVLDRAVSINGSADILRGCAPGVATKHYILPMLAPLHTLLGVERKGIGKRTREGREGNYEKYFINNLGPQRV